MTIINSISFLFFFSFGFFFLLLSDPTTIFRGNTLVSKMMDEGMRLAGLHYLHSTLRPAMEQVFLDKKQCEIDPSRVKDGNTVQTNLANLKVLMIIKMCIYRLF